MKTGSGCKAYLFPEGERRYALGNRGMSAMKSSVRFLTHRQMLPAKKPIAIACGNWLQAVTKSEDGRFAIRVQSCCAHASADVSLSGEMGWEVRSKGRSRWHDSRLKGSISQTGVG